MLCLNATEIKILISNWPRMRKFSQLGYYRQGRQLLLTLPTTAMRWSRSTSNFNGLIGQNMTGEFMRKIYAASWNLFTVAAKADRVLCQLVMFLTVFFCWMYEMKFSCYQESSCYSWLVCLLGFWFRNTSLVNVGNPISVGVDSFSFFTLLGPCLIEKSEAILAILDSFQELDLEW